ncbi:hypothetical protein A2U01_0100976, partial [Trifolium medium]|nr:hypothetical protein [Trifolium medium]
MVVVVTCRCMVEVVKEMVEGETCIHMVEGVKVMVRVETYKHMEVVETGMVEV